MVQVEIDPARWPGSGAGQVGTYMIVLGLFLQSTY